MSIQESWIAKCEDISQRQLEDYDCISQGKSCILLRVV